MEADMNDLISHFYSASKRGCDGHILPRCVIEIDSAESQSWSQYNNGTGVIGSSRGQLGQLQGNDTCTRWALCLGRAEKLIVTAWRISRAGDCGDAVVVLDVA